MLLLALSVLQLYSEYVGLYVEDGFHHTLHHSASSYEDVLASHWSLAYLQVASCANLFLLVDAVTLFFGTRKAVTATLISAMMMVSLFDLVAQSIATAFRFSLMWYTFYVVSVTALLLNLMAVVIVFASLAQLYLLRPLLQQFAFVVRDAYSHTKSTTNQTGDGGNSSDRATGFSRQSSTTLLLSASEGGLSATRLSKND